MVEITVLSAASNYQQVSLSRTVTALPAASSGWSYVVDVYNSIWGIQTSGTTSGSTDVHVLWASEGYSVRRSFPTALPQAPDDNMFSFSASPQLDLFCIKMNRTGTGTTEVHQLSWASTWQQFVLQTGTALNYWTNWTIPGQFSFSVTPDPDPNNVDVYCIMKNASGSSTTEVHVLQRYIEDYCYAIGASC
jgi:hypothetical protein